MLHHPLLTALTAFTAVIYLAGTYLMLQMRSAKPGYEDADGFHFLPELEAVVIYPDDERPDWFTGAVAERFSGRPVQIFAAAAA